MTERKQIIWGYIATLAANGVLLFAFNNLLAWQVPFLTESFRDCLWAINVSLGVVIIVNFVFIFFDRDRFKSLLQVFTAAASFMALYVIYGIFPFVFTNPAWYIGLKVFLIVAMAVTGASVIYNIIRTIVPQRLKT